MNLQAAKILQLAVDTLVLAATHKEDTLFANTRDVLHANTPHRVPEDFHRRLNMHVTNTLPPSPRAWTWKPGVPCTIGIGARCSPDCTGWIIPPLWVHRWPIRNIEFVSDLNAIGRDDWGVPALTTFEESVAYCDTIGARLPTFEEWEHFCPTPPACTEHGEHKEGEAYCPNCMGSNWDREWMLRHTAVNWNLPPDTPLPTRTPEVGHRPTVNDLYDPLGLVWEWAQQINGQWTMCTNGAWDSTPPFGEQTQNFKYKGFRPVIECVTP
jgi:hypothetical protein